MDKREPPRAEKSAEESDDTQHRENDVTLSASFTKFREYMEARKRAVRDTPSIFVERN